MNGCSSVDSGSTHSMGWRTLFSLAVLAVVPSCSAAEKLADALIPAGDPGLADSRVSSFAENQNVSELAMSEDRLYWVSSGGETVRYGVTGDEAKPLVEHSNAIATLTVFGSTLYFSTEYAGVSDVYSVDKMPGGSPTKLGNVEAVITEMVVDSDGMYAVDYRALSTDSRVVKISLPGATLEPLASNLEGVNCLAIDDTYAYYCAGTIENMTVYRVPKAGGAPDALAEGQAAIAGVAIGGDYIYWVNSHRVNKSPAVVRRAKKADGAGVEDLTSFEDFSEAMAINSTHVYYQGKSGIWRIPLAGGTAEKFINTKPEPGATDSGVYDLVVSDTLIGWSDGDAVRAATP